MSVIEIGLGGKNNFSLFSDEATSDLRLGSQHRKYSSKAHRNGPYPQAYAIAVMRFGNSLFIHGLAEAFLRNSWGGGGM